MAGSKLDPKFKYEVAAQPGGEQIKVCFSCGVCTAGCPVTEVHGQYDPRKIIRMVLLGMREEVLKSDLLWLCSSCYTCSAHCPQDVRFTNVMAALRQMATEEGYVHRDFSKDMEELNKFIHELRRDMILQAAPEKNSWKRLDLQRLLDSVRES